MKKCMSYRAEIDGLRAIAVLSVIFFHAGFEKFSGGYVGVDIFFVISGFLITTIILVEQDRGTFSLLQFYERRARRILPALFFVMLVGLPFAWFWMIPAQLQSFSQSIMAVCVFMSNIFFWRTSGYFGAVAEEQPLLHTWSLGIEEQFYLFFPLFILAFWRYGLKKLYWLGTALLIASLLLSQYEWHYHAMANFFLLPTRAWELLIGCLLAMTSVAANTPSQKNLNNGLSCLGFFLILVSLFFFNKTIPNPSFYTLIPTLGTALILGFAHQETWVGRLLSSKCLVRIGLISYSAYLWHQPLFAFARLYSPRSLSTGVFIFLSSASLGLAYFTWRFVEKPFRNKQTWPTKRLIIAPLFASVFFLSIGLAGYLNHGFEKRFQVPFHIVQSFAIPERSKECFDLDNGHLASRWNCLVNDHITNKNIDFVVFGDSHALQMLSGFEVAAKLINKNGIITGFSGCTPFLGVYPLIREDQKNRDCYALNQRVFNFIKKNHIKNLFLVARWTYYTNGGYTEEPRFINFIGTSKSDPITLDATRQAFVKGLDKTIKAYGDLGVHIYLIEQIPAQLSAPQSVYYEAYSKPYSVKKALLTASVTRKQHIKLQSFVHSVFQRYQNDSRITFINFDNIVCNKTVCPIGTQLGSYYEDNNHLSKLGTLRLSSEIKRILSMTS